MTTDLTVGKPSQKLFWFSIPLLLSVAFQQLYQMADSIIVGRFAETVEAGELALAAVGASYPITQLFVAVATGINIGTGVLVSQLFGAKRYLRMKTAISTALLTTTAVALLLTLIGAIGTTGIMNALSTPENIFADGSLYLRVYVFGLLFLFIYNVCTGIFNAMGDSRTPLILLVISSVGNVILDIVFVAMLHWGVAGVAWATFIAQGASGILAFVLLLRRVRSFDTGHHFVLFAPEMLRRLTNYAIPSIAQQSFVSVGNLIIQYYVNLCGPTVIAGFSVANRINMFALTCCMSFASGLSSFVAQNIGARKYHNLDRVIRNCLLCVVVTGLVLGGGAALAGNQLLRFYSSDTAVIATGIERLRIICGSYLLCGIMDVLASSLRGLGYSVLPMVVSLVGSCLLRLVWIATIFQLNRTPFMLYISYPISWVLTAAVHLACLLVVRHKMRQRGQTLQAV